MFEKLLRWLPPDVRVRVLKRGLIVWGVSVIIAVAQWLARPDVHPLDNSFVYSFAISTCIWFLSDPLRIALWPWLRLASPHYWAWSLRIALYLLLSAVLGYAVGTFIGDAYAGQSTWELWSLSPKRFLGFALSSLAISLGFIFYFSHTEEARELRRQATEARLKLLESQLEPHMLFNTLANLRVLIATDPARAITMLDRLNAFLRATLQASRSDSLNGGQTLADEFGRLDDYLALMAVRMGPRLTTQLNLPEALRTHPIPPLLLQPLVENAIRHGLEPKLGGGEIRVSAAALGNRLVLTVADTGVGMPQQAAPTPTSSHSGFGLAQVRERVSGIAGARGQVTVESTAETGTRICIELPLNLAT